VIIRLNGQPYALNEGTETIADLLEQLSLTQRIVIVEWNKKVLDKKEHATTRLAGGDVVEIVHFVGGG
jgi:sulfur carrier protein